MTVSGELAPGYSHIAPQIFTLRLSEFFLSPPTDTDCRASLGPDTDLSENLDFIQSLLLCCHLSFVAISGPQCCCLQFNIVDLRIDEFCDNSRM